MMRELRWRFVALAMGAVFLVLLIIVGAINVSVAWERNKRMDAILDVLADNGGRFPAAEVLRLDPATTTETPFESRYFIARINSRGKVSDLDTAHIARAQAEHAHSYAIEAFHDPNERGVIGHFRYLRVPERTGGASIYFLDEQMLASALHTFRINSIVVAVIGFLAVSGLIILFSGRVIRPFVENIRLQRRFITDAGHELKTPLSVISANADIIELTQGKSEWTASIHRQVLRMNALISELLKLATMEERPIHREDDVDLRHLLTDAIDSFKPMATHEQITLRTHLPEHPVIIKGDGQSLANLFSVLIDNAIKYAPEGATIDLALHPRSKAGAHFRITNPALHPPDPQELNRLFERFYRADESRSRAGGGFGIGLSMAKAIVHAHHGQISASCDGTSVSFDIDL